MSDVKTVEIRLIGEFDWTSPTSVVEGSRTWLHNLGPHERLGDAPPLGAEAQHGGIYPEQS